MATINKVKRAKLVKKIKKVREKNIKKLLRGIHGVPEKYQEVPVPGPEKIQAEPEKPFDNGLFDPAPLKPSREMPEWARSEGAAVGFDEVEMGLGDPVMPPDAVPLPPRRTTMEESHGGVAEVSVDVVQAQLQVLEQKYSELAISNTEAALKISSLEERNRALLAASSSGNGLPVWEGRDLRVLMPSMKFCNAMTSACLIALALDFGRDKIGFDFEFGDSMIYHARNKLASRFLETGASWALWLDDDMVPPVGRPDFTAQYTGIKDIDRGNFDQHVVKRLMSHGKTLVGATYFGRRTAGPPMFAEGLNNLEANMDARNRSNKVRPTRWVATGCMLVHRSVFLAIQKKFPELAPTATRREWDFFRPGADGGEDVMFCLRAAEAGHQPHVDTHLHCLHVGFAAYHAGNTNDGIKDRYSAV